MDLVKGRLNLAQMSSSASYGAIRFRPQLALRRNISATSFGARRAFRDSFHRQFARRLSNEGQFLMTPEGASFMARRPV